MGQCCIRTQLMCINTAPNTSLVGKKIYCKVIDVYDGDTITVITKTGVSSKAHSYKVRLYGIDTPELHPKKTIHNRKKHMEAAQIVKQKLSRAILNKVLLIEFKTVGKFGREVGTIWKNGVNINEKLIKEGCACAYLGGKKEPFTDKMIDLIISNKNDN